MSRGSNGNGNGSSLTLLIPILTSILQLLGQLVQANGRIEANQATGLANHQTVIALLTGKQKESKLKATLSALGWILGHWGTVGAIIAAFWRFAWPSVKPLLGP